VKIVFALSLAGIFYTYFGYPIAIWLLACLRGRQRTVSTITPSVSIVLAVRNGMDRLQAKIQHLLELDYSGIKEIIIVSDGSTDGTAEYVTSLQLERIKTVVLRKHGGKAAAVNAGVVLATGDIILFVDIRPEIAPGAIQRLVNNFADPQVGCVAGELILRHEGHDAASEAVGGLYWRYEQWLRKCEAAFDSPVGVYGGFYAIRKELFIPIPPGTILDDMFEPLSIIRQGYRSALESTAFVYDVWPKKVVGEFHRKVRTLAGNFQLFKLAPWTLTSENRAMFQLVSHKVMRLVVPYLMVALFISSAMLSWDSRLMARFTLLQLSGWVLALAGLRFRIPIVQRIVSPMSALLVLNIAAVVGLYRFLFTPGPLWTIWTANKPQETKQMVAARGSGQGSTVPVAVVEINDGPFVPK
jgi:biofilm PGA synthesis N-glycosyltransferase PgaC